MFKSKRCISMVLVLLLGVIMLSGCGGSSSGDQASTGNVSAGDSGGGGKALKVGMGMDLTGPLAMRGQEGRDTITMMLEDIDYMVGDVKIEPVWYDCQNDPNVAARALEQAIVKDGIDVNLFPYSSTVAVAGMEVNAKYGIPNFSSAGGTGVINEKWLSDEKYQLWLKNNAAPNKLIGDYLGLIEQITTDGTWDLAPEEKLYFNACEDTDWGRDIVSYMDEGMQSLGWTKAGEEFYMNTETDFLTLISKIKSSGARLIFGTNMVPSSNTAFVKQCYEQQVPALIMLDGITELEGFIDMIGEGADGVLDCRGVFNSEEAFEFADRFKEKYGYDITPLQGGQFHDLFQIFLDVVAGTDEKYGEVTTETLKQFQQEVIYTGEFRCEDVFLIPAYTWDENSLPDPVYGEGAFTYPILQVIEGEVEIVYPADQKTADFFVPELAQ